MNVQPFSLARLPRIEFGSGCFAKVPGLAAACGRRALLITGERSFQQSPHWHLLTDALRVEGVAWEHERVSGEPSPQLVDTVVGRYRAQDLGVVVGIGGGSVLDAAKAIAGLLPHGNSVVDHLEGVGPEKPYTGPSTPFIAVPTTAGTGSEATKNAVLSVQGADGYKKSFRHELLVPQYAVVDPLLLAGCPPELIAANGMDALTQLIESYVSTRASRFTDALALSGIEAARDGLLPWYRGAENAAEARSAMAYAALISGITLAQTGLGSVHGLASPLGAFFPIPHGVVCGTLVAAATEMNIRAMQAREPDNPALEKYAHLGSLLTGKSYRRRENGWDALVRTLADWTRKLHLPGLGRFNVAHGDIPKIVASSRGSSMKTNPIVLTDEEIGEVVDQRL